MTLKVTLGHCNCHYLVGHLSFSIVICSNSISILRCFQDITTFSVYVTDYDLKKSSVSISQLILQVTCALRFTSKNNVVNIVFPEVWELERLQTASDLQRHSSLKVVAIGAI